MNAGRKVVEKRLGRPPATDSGDTKRRILDIAREMFSVHGYEVTTNRDIATAAGITSGALYHYFGSKLDLYLAVHEDVQAGVYESFSNATMNLETFTEMFLAVLEVAHDMNENDPSVARFIGAVRVDAQRHPEMAAALSPRSTQREVFFTRLIDIGVKTDLCQVAAGIKKNIGHGENVLIPIAVSIKYLEIILVDSSGVAMQHPMIIFVQIE